MKKTQKRSGFTLVELLVVIAIIGILSTMLFGPISGAIDKAKKTTVSNNIKNIAQSFANISMNSKKISKSEAGQSANEFAIQLAKEGGETSNGAWFAGNFPEPDGDNTLAASILAAEQDFKNAEIAFDVAAGLPPSLGSKSSYVPVVWTRGIKWNENEKEMVI